MTRTERLLQLMQLLRANRAPVTGEHLAAELGVSVRTIYRDIATLQWQGADIEGTPGHGYRLQPGFMLPPMMFTIEEIEALVLGARWVSTHTDSRLATAADNALARIAAVLPADLRETLDTTSLTVPHLGPPVPEGRELARMREAIRTEIKVRIAYRDAAGQQSQRTIWPIALAYFDQVRMVAAWCEQRNDFRHFRTDRIDHLELTAETYPVRKSELLKQWRAQRFDEQGNRKGEPASAPDKN
jgi:predicted DNA-binding transcriptional regulator YafY